MTDVAARQIDYMTGQMARIEENMIDPREFGRLEGEVKALTKKVDDLQTDVKALLELANRGRGGFWAGMTFASGLGAAVMWAADHFLRR